MIDTIGMTDIGNGRPSNQDAYLLRQKEKERLPVIISWKY